MGTCDTSKDKGERCFDDAILIARDRVKKVKVEGVS